MDTRQGTKNYTIEPIVYSRLETGIENAIHSAQLMKELHMSDRKLSRQIQEERQNGYFIMRHNSYGYYKPKNIREFTECVESLKNQSHEIFKATESMERAFNEAMKQGKGYDQYIREERQKRKEEIENLKIDEEVGK